MSDKEKGPPINEENRAGWRAGAALEGAHSATSEAENSRHRDLRQGLEGPFARNNSTGETAQAARDFVRPKVPNLQALVLQIIEAQPSSPEQIHARLTAMGVRTVLTSVRPRTSELARKGLIKDSKRRALAESGRCKAIVWVATDADERARFDALKAVESANGGQTHG